MAEDRDDAGGPAPSLDPRTWTVRPTGGKAAEAAPPHPPSATPPSAPEETSFDPRSWGGGASPPLNPAASAAPGRRGLPPAAWAGGALALAVLGGGAWWIAGRGAPPKPRSAPPTAAVAPQPTAPPSPTVTPPTPAPLPVAPAEGETHRSLTLAGAGQLADALASAGVPAADAQAAARAAAARLGPKPGELRVAMDLTPSGATASLTRLEARRPDGSGVVVARGADGGWAATLAANTLSHAVKVVRGEMDANSFYSSAVAAGVNDTLIPAFAQAFAFDFDFQREIKAGDIFEAAFETPKDATGQVVGAERLLFVSLSTAAKSKALYRFTPPGETEAGWFDSNGRSIVRSLMRTPVEGARVSSTFGMRVHPVLGYTKMHNGIDFAAPVGTPIYAAGDATVKWAAMKGPNGNLTILTHDNGWETYYLHQNAFAPGVTPGARVRQGQNIGWIGTTGRSTGPHLHYEVHIDSKPVDPATIQVAAGHSLAGPALLAFNKERDRIDAQRAAQTQ